MIFQQTQPLALSVAQFTSPLSRQPRVSRFFCTALLAGSFLHHNVLQTFFMFRLRLNDTEAAELSYDSSDIIVFGVGLL